MKAQFWINGDLLIDGSTRERRAVQSAEVVEQPRIEKIMSEWSSVFQWLVEAQAVSTTLTPS